MPPWTNQERERERLFWNFELVSIYPSFSLHTLPLSRWVWDYILLELELVRTHSSYTTHMTKDRSMQKNSVSQSNFKPSLPPSLFLSTFNSTKPKNPFFKLKFSTLNFLSFFSSHASPLPHIPASHDPQFSVQFAYNTLSNQNPLTQFSPTPLCFQSTRQKMEGGWKSEQNTVELINELTEGMEVAKQLKLHLHSSSSAQAREVLLQRMSSSFEKALLILKWSSGSGGQNCQPAPPTSGVPETSISAEESPQSEDLERGLKDHQDVSKKRKLMPTWTEQVKVSSENGVETPADDGYSWRKYGQKDILGAKYPRSYYRCTYRNVHNCWATKQVQRSDEDHTTFDITYKGTHTCNAAPPSPEKQEPKHMKHHNTTSSNLGSNHHPQQQSSGLLYNYRTNLRVNTNELDRGEMAPSFTFPSNTFGYENQSQNYPFSELVNDALLENLCPSFVSPATSGSNFFGASPSPMNSMGGVFNLQHSESDLTDIISAATSTSNSPILDLDFPINPAELDPNFPFDNPGFFN